MKTTGRAKGAGPHRTLARGKPKSEEWCGKPAGLHGPLLLGCGQRLALQGSSANEGRFCQFKPQVSQSTGPVSLGCIPSGHPGTTPVAMRILPSQRTPACAYPGKSTRDRARNPDFSQPCRHGLGHPRLHEERIWSGNIRVPPPANGRVSARASRGPARSGSRRRPRRSPRWWQASAHRGRCQAV